MSRIQSLIDETNFHIDGMEVIIHSLVQSHPRTCPELIRTLSYSLGAMMERRDILAEVSRAPVDVSA